MFNLRNGMKNQNKLSQLGDGASNLHYSFNLFVVGCWKEGLQLMSPHSPPPSFKRVLLEYNCLSKAVAPYLSWLFAPREDYSLHELKLR